jgi:hypothetical protein
VTICGARQILKTNFKLALGKCPMGMSLLKAPLENNSRFRPERLRASGEARAEIGSLRFLTDLANEAIGWILRFAFP